MPLHDIWDRADAVRWMAPAELREAHTPDTLRVLINEAVEAGLHWLLLTRLSKQLAVLEG